MELQGAAGICNWPNGMIILMLQQKTPNPTLDTYFQQELHLKTSMGT